MIVTALLVPQIIWLLIPMHLNRLEEPYRREERYQAFNAWRSNQTAETKAAWQEESRRLSDWVWGRTAATIGLFVLGDTFALKWIWRRYGTAPKTARP